MTGRGSRHLLVWLHVVTSVGWMAMALALLTLLVVGIGDPGVRHAAFSMAGTIDATLLAYLANGSAYTGIMLCALTSWGFFRHWWVLVKFVITFVQLYLGIFLLSGTLHAAVDASAHGGLGPAVPLAAGTGLMMSAIGFQAWLSVAKPWRRTPWAAAGKLPTAPAWLFAAAVAVPVADVLLSAFVTGRPLPALSLLTVIGYPVYRAVALRRGARRPVPVTT